MKYIIVFFTVLTVLVCVVPLSRHPHWIVRGMDFPRLQIAVWAAIVVVTALFFLDLRMSVSWILIGATTLCFAWQMWWILPYTPLWPVETKSSANDHPQREITILTSNVLTPNRNAKALIDLIKKHKPDVLVALETDQWWEDQLSVVEEDMPYSVKCPLDNLYGMHVYSKLPLSDEEISYLVEKDVPSIHASLSLRNGVEVRVHFLHPAPPSPSENPESAERDAELVIVGRSVAESKKPVIVTGDLNDVAWSATTRLFRKISGLLDPRVGRGMFNTFHVDYPFLRWPLDHLFHSQHFTVKSIQRLPTIDSDHFPLLTTLTFTPIKGSDQEGLKADRDDKEWAEEITDDQNVNKKDVPEPGE